MKYHVNYQYLPKGASRPVDDGTTVELSVDESGFALLPDAGDFVALDNSMNDMASFHGKVKSRLFSYTQGKDVSLASCIINIVVEETDDDWGKLIKE
jgi:hypothetical protein